jgi:very-short-patch-repair endonuclease
MANVHPLPTEVLNNARELRRNITDHERLLWELLRGRRFNGIKFRHQHPVPPYVLDFYAPELRLAIELDGGHHSAQLNKDQARDQHLAALGIRTFRFWNSSVNNELEGVLEQLWIETVR